MSNPNEGIYAHNLVCPTHTDAERQAGYGCPICARLKADRLEAQLKLANEDSADDDTRIRNLVRPILGKDKTDGDSYGVPSLVTLVEELLARLSGFNCSAFNRSLPQVFVNDEGKLVELFLEDVPSYDDWIPGEGGDVCLLRAMDDDRIVGARLPLPPVAREGG